MTPVVARRRFPAWIPVLEPISPPLGRVDEDQPAIALARAVTPFPDRDLLVTVARKPTQHLTGAVRVDVCQPPDAPPPASARRKARMPGPMLPCSGCTIAKFSRSALPPISASFIR